MCDLSVLMC